jgi:peptidoglycan-N-acetylmuramic acid deacetylase
MKKGKGKVPNFPKETKTFTPEQNTVWVGTGKKVYLTFDNGGPMGDTKKLLKALKDNDVKATFFIAGYNLKAHPDFLKELIADGHLVGNHTMSHKDMTKLTDDQVKKELSDFESLYKGISGDDQPKFFRFPYGIYNRHLLSVVANMGYKSVFWSTAMKDWVPQKNGAEDAYNNIMNNLHDGNVILMHQGSDDNIAALGKIIKGIKEAGYGFGLVNEL